jgi:alginate O-acetyltransferase complex protein AlgI
MLFNSVSFIFLFLPITVAGFFFLSRVSHRLALLFLTMASLFFYMQTNYRYIYILLPSIIINYSIGIKLSEPSLEPKFRRGLLITGIAANLLCLFTFKYLDLFIECINALGLARVRKQNIELPLGISFFTFTQIAFLVDAYQHKVREAKFINYALFVSYFPHLVAGPILHHSEMMPQFSAASTYRAEAKNFALGLSIFFIGLFKKVMLADSVAPHVHKVFDAAAQGTVLTTLEGWSGALFYALQIYFDFSGYSDMAIGLSLLFGVRLPLNFNSPYKAVNIIDFWRRWHMTLSRFLRDYLYIPLGGNRVGTARRLANVTIVMLLGGLWHGASWTFVVWGGLHGIYLVINHSWQSLVGVKTEQSRLSLMAGGLTTFLLVTFAWVFFRAPDMQTALALVWSMLGFNGTLLPHAAPNFPSGDLASIAVLLLAVVWLCPNTQEIMSNYKPALQSGTIAKAPAIALWQPNWAYAVIIGSIALASLTTIVYVKRVGDFIYFQF